MPLLSASTNGTVNHEYCSTLSNERVEQRIRLRGDAALDLLQEACQYARLLSENIWEFAIGVTTLGRSGLSLNDLRWLMHRGVIQHAQETTLPGDHRRTFRPAGMIRFDLQSCFVLTEAGTDFLAHHYSVPDQVIQNASAEQYPEEATIPTWDSERQELRLGTTIVKSFKAPAPNQELILATFEEEGWPIHIDDPLPPFEGQDSKRRLHDTINSLNRNQRNPLIRFIGDGSGEGVRWELSS